MILDELFRRSRAEKRAAFIPYLMAGDPDVATTATIMDALRAAGADFLELGIPYGDPLADGPAIAAAGARALRGGVGIDEVLELVQNATLPVVLFSYYNPVLQYGLERFAAAARDMRVAGVIVPDLAFEEAAPLGALLQSHGIAMPLLVAPTTALGRAQLIARQATGFVYVVSRLGVTGTGVAPDFAPLLAQLAALRTVTEKPLAVGFGLSTREHLREVAPHADGVIVGSALIGAYQNHTGADAASKVSEFVARLN